jgi:hypothetical protein
MQWLCLTLAAEGVSPLATGGDTIRGGDVMPADGAGSGGSAVTVIDAKPGAWLLGSIEVPAQAWRNKTDSRTIVIFLIRTVLPKDEV